MTKNYISLRIVILFLSVTIVSCIIGNPDEISDEGEKVCKTFYSFVEKGDFNSATAMCGGNLSYSDGFGVLQKIDSLLGKLDSAQYIDGIYKTAYRKGLAKSQWELYFKGFYGNRVTNESFVLIKINDSIKIDGYHIKEILPQNNTK